MKKLFWMLAVLLMLPVMSRADSSISRIEADQFPLIMYAVPGTDADFALMKSMGIDYVHVYGMSKGPLEEGRLKSIEKYLDLAQKHGLKVMFDLDGHRRVRNGDRNLALEETRVLARKFKDHPALGFWYLYDEPELSKGSDPDVLKQFYDLLKVEAPGIPVCVCTSTVKEKRPGLDYMWNSFSDTYDLHIFDTYPVKGQVFPEANLSTVTAFNEKALALGKPVVPALQAWNYITIDRYVKRAVEAGQSTADWRYPHLKELRFWNFATLIQGARGMSYWSYARAAKVPKSNAAWVKSTLKPAVLEFREFTDLVQPAREKDVLDIGAEMDLFFARWKHDGKQYLALVNGEKQARKISDATILQSLNSAKLKPWKFTRNDALQLQNNRVSAVNLEPWEVAVWEVQ